MGSGLQYQCHFNRPFPSLLILMHLFFLNFKNKAGLRKWHDHVLCCVVIEPALHVPCQCLLSTITMPEMEDYIFANRTHHVYRDLQYSWAVASQADDLQLKYEVLMFTRHRMIKVKQEQELHSIECTYSSLRRNTDTGQWNTEYTCGNLGQNLIFSNT